MVKLIICAARKPGTTHEEFSAYWREKHGPQPRPRRSAARRMSSWPSPEDDSLALTTMGPRANSVANAMRRSSPYAR